MSSLEREYTTESQPLSHGTGAGLGHGTGPSTGQRRTGGMGDHRDPKPFFLTSEFMVLVGLIVAIMIAAAVASDFRAPRAWLLATVLGAAYMVSRGLAKIGRGDGTFL